MHPDAPKPTPSHNDEAQAAAPAPAPRRRKKAPPPAGETAQTVPTPPLPPEAADPAPADAPTGSADIFAAVLSGAFDASADGDAAAPEPPKRVLAPQADSPKLHKVLAQAGLGSRLEMERLITEGRISVNSEPAHIGQRIQFGDTVKINGKPVQVRIAPPAPRVIAYHKPVGEVVTHDDPQNRPTVFRKLPRLQHGKWLSVGRLDLNTEGLLLLTNSGELANQLMHPRFGLQREYAVRVLGALSVEEKQLLTTGVQLDDGPAQFGQIEEGGGEGANCWYRVTIAEGRNREVRRMFEALGHAVSRLIRIRYGILHLPRFLRRGQWMELNDKDLQGLMKLVGMEPPRRGESPQAAQTRRRNPDRSSKQGPKRALPEGRAEQRPFPPPRSAAAAPRTSNNRRGATPDPLQTRYGRIDGATPGQRPAAKRPSKPANSRPRGRG